MKSLVLVIGAGASKEVNLPVGAELKSQIARLLDIRFKNGIRQESGDYQLTEALRLVANKQSLSSINDLLQMCWRIRDAMPQAISIDNFVDCHAGERNIAVCGKLAIARAILSAEAGSTLNVERMNAYNTLNFEANANTWFNGFFQIVTENCCVDQLPARLEQIGIINFNYDRCVEHFFFYSLQNYYGISPEMAAELLAHLEIHHPYGFVGKLPWTGERPGINFGADAHANNLVDIAEQLRTFTEGTDPSVSDIERIRRVIHEARSLVFLGFAFHRLNMELIFGVPSASATKTIFGTALGISASDCRVISDELVSYTKLDGGRIQLRNDLNCSALVGEYWRSLSLNRQT